MVCAVLLSPSKKELQECLKQMKELVAEDKVEFNEKARIFLISQGDRKSTRLNPSHENPPRMPSSA